MGSLRALLCRLSAVFWKRKTDEDLEEELRWHVGMLEQENLRRGLTPEQARREAYLAIGGLEQTKEMYREARCIPFIDSALRDLRFAARLMVSKPAFTLAVAAVLAASYLPARRASRMDPAAITVTTQ